MSVPTQLFISFDKKTLDLKFNPIADEKRRDYFPNIEYALFSTFSNKDECSIYLKEPKSNRFFLEFTANYTEDKDEILQINKCRNIAYSYLKFCGIPIIVQSPNEKLSSSYFIDVGASPFQHFPGLAKLLYPEQLELCCVIYGPEIKLYNEVVTDFINVMDGLSPSTNSFRVSCYSKIPKKDILFKFPILDSKRPKYAQTYNNEIAPKDILINTYKLHLADTKFPKLDVFYSISFVDIGYPEESMIAASSESNSLFLTPNRGEFKYVSNQNIKYNKLGFLFRSLNYDDTKQNLITFSAAFQSSSNIIIPFSVPCHDILKVFSLFAKTEPELHIPLYERKGYSKYLMQKRIFMYIEIPPKGSKKIHQAAELAFQQIKLFEKMEAFRTTKFYLMKSIIELVNELHRIEKSDILAKFKDAESENYLFVSSYNIIDGINTFIAK